jgi:hypothetical protein
VEQVADGLALAQLDLGVLLEQPLGHLGRRVRLQHDAAAVQVQVARVAVLLGRVAEPPLADLLADGVGGLLGDVEPLDARPAARELLRLGLADVAVGSEVVPNGRPEQREARDVMSPTKCGQGVTIDRQCRAHTWFRMPRVSGIAVCTTGSTRKRPRSA